VADAKCFKRNGITTNRRFPTRPRRPVTSSSMPQKYGADWRLASDSRVELLSRWRSCSRDCWPCIPCGSMPPDQSTLQRCTATLVPPWTSSMPPSQRTYETRLRYAIGLSEVFPDTGLLWHVRTQFIPYASLSPKFGSFHFPFVPIQNLDIGKPASGRQSTSVCASYWLFNWFLDCRILTTGTNTCTIFGSR
jgi:hypothetical protein